MTEPHPELGEQVYYYDPSITMKPGFRQGYGTPGRGVGPYLAIVINDKPGATLQVMLCLPDSPAYSVTLRHKNDVSNPKEPYWDWKDALQKARAVKREKPAEEPAPARVRHPGAAAHA